LILGSFVPDPAAAGRDDDHEAEELLFAFLSRGPRDERTTLAWMNLRSRLAVDLVLADLLETGAVDVVGADAAGEPLFAVRRAGPS
jgi:hypothetical protein